MPIITSPNSISVAQALQTLAKNITISAVTVNGLAVTSYNTVIIGSKKDVTNCLPLMEIVVSDDHCVRDAMAGLGFTTLVNDEQLFECITTVDYTDSSNAETLILALRDQLTQQLLSSLFLGNVAGIIGVWLDGNGVYGYAMRNGVWCRMHRVKVRVEYHYRTTMVV